MDNVEKITEEIRNIVAEIIDVDPEKVTLDARFVDDSGMDSTAAIEILAAVEGKYKIAILDEELKKIATLSQVVALAREYSAQEARKKQEKESK